MVKAYVKEVGFGPQDDIFGAHYTPAHINRYMYKKTIMCYLKKAQVHRNRFIQPKTVASKVLSVAKDA